MPKDSEIITASCKRASRCRNKTAYCKEQPVASGAIASAQSKMDDAKLKEYETNAREEDKKQCQLCAFEINSAVWWLMKTIQPSFANVTETKSGVGTYADVKRKFYIGFTWYRFECGNKISWLFSNSLRIRSNETQRIVLKDESVMANAPTRERRCMKKNKDRPSAMKNRSNGMESEPADGWKNYSTYIVIIWECPFQQKRANQPNWKKWKFRWCKPDGTIANLKIERSDCNPVTMKPSESLKKAPNGNQKPGKRACPF